MEHANPIVILMGQTASGKSAAAVRLAQRYQAEIINADSRQVYHGMEIGTAAPSQAERLSVPHHLVGFLNPHERYSAARFLFDANRCIAEIRQRGNNIIITGGTGFYLRTLCGDMQLSVGGYDALVRERLEREARVHSTEWLYDWLKQMDPHRAESMKRGDTYRILRALEVVLCRRDQKSEMPSDGDKYSLQNLTLRAQNIAYQKIWLQVSTEVLRERITLRIDAMLAQGFLAEAEHVGRDAVAADAVGYPTAFSYLAGWLTHREMREQLIRATTRYAKRQATWLRKEPDIKVLEPESGFHRLCSMIEDSTGWRPV